MYKIKEITFSILMLLSIVITAAAQKKSSIKTESLSYTIGDEKFLSYVAYDNKSSDKRPVVLVVHEWWGMNDYVKRRTRQLAELGYLAVAVDLYGEGKIANNVEEAVGFSTPFYKDPILAKSHFDAALEKIKLNRLADTNYIAAIGYCFGGSMVLNFAKMGENLKGVVSFHGGLAGVPPTEGLLKSELLICHGADDKFVSAEEVTNFKKELESVNAIYTFKEYPEATHAFTNPDATEMGKKFKIPIAYNEPADLASWKEMKSFLKRIFK
jgi:dienelactone hydrolase